MDRFSILNTNQRRNVVKKNFWFYSLTLVGIPFIFFFGNVSTFRVHFPWINYQIFIFIIIIINSSSSSSSTSSSSSSSLSWKVGAGGRDFLFLSVLQVHKKKPNCFSLLKKIKLLFSLWKKTIKLTFLHQLKTKSTNNKKNVTFSI